MLDLNYVREHTDEVETALDNRGMPLSLQPLRDLDTKRRDLLQEVEALKTHRHESPRQIGGIMEGDANPDPFIPRRIGLRRQGRFPFDRMISYYSFDGIATAVADLENARVLKPVLRP